MSESRDIAIVRTGTANLASVLSAFDRLGERPRLTADPADVESAEYLVLPGVGSFGAAMENLARAGLVEPLRARISAGTRTLCVCLGLQLLFQQSEESPGARGLGVAGGCVSRFSGEVRVPQLAWNTVEPAPGEGYVTRGDAYFANSFRVDAAPVGWRAATSDYGGTFIASIERGGVLACQFHPELSGDWGMGLLARWLDARPAPGPGSSLFTARGPTRLVPVRVVPCLDVRDGRVVKGVRFQDLRDAGDPAQQAARYGREGADEIVVLDVSATTAGRAHQVETVRAVRRVLNVPITVGGGVRTFDDASRLLDAGADKVGVNTAAVQRPQLVSEIASRLGSQCAVLALDAARTAEGRWEVVTHAGTTRTGLDAVEWARNAAALGAGEILLTSFDRDGTGAGYDTELIAAIAGAVGVPVIASGGASGPAHMAEAVRAGAGALLAATIFHDGLYTPAKLKDELARAGVPVRRGVAREHSHAGNPA